MDRKYSFDVLPSGNLFSELVDFTDTGYFDDQSLGESGQQACQEMTTYLREEPPEFGDFRQEEPYDCGDCFQTESPESGDSPQKEPGKCGDSPQKPPECDGLPQEKAWVQPLSPPTSPPSLIPTYTILTMTCVPLSDFNESTDISPEETGMSPQITGISPQMTDISPQMTDISPQMTDISPQMTDISPQMTDISPQMTDISPQMTDISPQMIDISPQTTTLSPQIIVILPQMTSISPQITSISPQMISISPQMTSISPQMTSISPQMNSISPQMTGMSPQVMSSPVPVPHAKKHGKTRKSLVIERRNGYHCDFPTCNKVYTLRKFLNTHKKSHTKPYRCTVEGCKWRFARLNCINRHIRSKHTASKSFHCRHCGKSFARSDNLAKHETVRCPVGRKLQRKNE